MGGTELGARLWGRIRRPIESDSAAAQASAADLCRPGCRRSRPGHRLFLAAHLRRRKRCLQASVAAFGRSLEIVQNQFDAGTVSRVDLAQAQTQLEQTRAQPVAEGINRANFEHAIAALDRPTPPFGFAGRRLCRRTCRPSMPASVGPARAAARHRRGRTPDAGGQRPDRRGPGGLLSRHLARSDRQLGQHPARRPAVAQQRGVVVRPAACRHPDRRRGRAAQVEGARANYDGRSRLTARPSSPPSSRSRTRWPSSASWSCRRRCSASRSPTRARPSSWRSTSTTRHRALHDRVTTQAAALQASTACSTSAEPADRQRHPGDGAGRRLARHRPAGADADRLLDQTPQPPYPRAKIAPQRQWWKFWSPSTANRA